MKSSTKDGDHPSGDDPLPVTEKGQVVSPPLRQEVATARRRRYPFATKKRVIFIGVLLLIAIIFGARFLVPLLGPHPKWSFQPEGNAFIHVLPLVTNETVYVITYLSSYKNILVALDARSGSKRWSAQLEGSISDQPAVADGQVYVVADFLHPEGHSTLYVLDAKSGHKQWSFQTEDPIPSPPAVAGGVAYLASSNGTLYALDARSGHTLWSERLRESTLFSPIVAGNLVYVTSTEAFAPDNMIYALDASTGHQRWSFQIGAVLTWVPLVVVNGLVYVTGNDRALDGAVYALDAQSGNKQWSFQTRYPMYTPPIVNDGMIYISDYFGNVNVFDARSGDQKWAFQLGRQSFNAYPTVAKGTVYLAAEDGTVYALDASTGHKRWSAQTGYVVGFWNLSPIVVADGWVYGDTEKGEVYALDGASGSKQWSYHMEGHMEFAPIVVGGLVYVVSYQTLYALQPFS